MSDSDDAIQAEQAPPARPPTRSAPRARRPRATTGESEPLLAIQDALAGFPADRIIVFRGDGDAYREEDFAEAQERFGVPVTEV